MLGSTKLIPGDSLLAQSEKESMGMKLVTDWPLVQEELSALMGIISHFLSHSVQ